MSGEADALDEVTPEIVRRIEEALAEGNSTDARTLLESLSASGQASVVASVARLATGAVPTTVRVLSVGASDTVSTALPLGSGRLSNGAGTTITLSY